MPKHDTLPHNLQKKEVVKAAIDLRGVPEGTTGQVILSNGLDWVRYWVAFDNGVEMGSLHRDKLIREDEWDDYLLKREQSLQMAENEPELTDDSEEPPSGSGSGGVEVNGVHVPQLLLDRTQAALERFGVSR
ncbi:MAG: hypothetical protein CBC90_04795 [Acidimicrobiaceae bacterium TMED130]|nr:MAG: hypothetical protein CBC90_04795 [Acidimicrobiaceae bacterium TMED130]|tara:strand:+ start:3683 stop:4078 length:396 start_codon:yes stop_codon:yes gene_type:complete